MNQAILEEITNLLGRWQMNQTWYCEKLPGRLLLISQAVNIIAEYQADGYDLTLRQL